MAQLVDGQKIARTVLSEIAAKRRKARLVIILVGENPASLSYIRMKQKYGGAAGIKVDVIVFPVGVSESELRTCIRKLNNDPGVDGIIVQLPLPTNLDRQAVLDEVSGQLDVDCLTSTNKAKLATGVDVLFIPPAAAAVLKILEYYQIDLRDKQVLVIGEGDLIGKPLAGLLKNQGIKFVVANRQTPDLPKIAIGADVIVTGTGKANLLTGDMVKQGATVIDAGTTGAEDGAVVGDVDTESVARKAGGLAAASVR